MVNDEERYSWTRMVLGDKAMDILRDSSVAVFGLGGVGGPAAEALARAGVGHIHLIDGDTVDRSNINRQIIAFESTVGKYKTLVMKERIGDIDPKTEVITYEKFFTEQNAKGFRFGDFDHIIDAIDSVTDKIFLIETAYRKGIPIISSMGMGNKTDPAAIQVADIFSTSGCPLARVMRRAMKAKGIPELKVVFSGEKPIKPAEGHRFPGSVSFVPPVAGYILAGEVIKYLTVSGKDFL